MFGERVWGEGCGFVEHCELDQRGLPVVLTSQRTNSTKILSRRLAVPLVPLSSASWGRVMM